MSKQPNKALMAKVDRAVDRVLARDGRISYPALLVEMGHLAPGDLTAWQRGRVPFLEKVIHANLTKLARIQTAVRRSAPDTKHRANKRDVLALLDHIAGCIDNHPSQVFEKATWGDVGSIAHLRGRLIEIATGFALGADGDEDVTRLRIEEALASRMRMWTRP